MYEDKPPFRWQDRADRTVVLIYAPILLWASVTVKAGIDFLDAGHGIAARDIGTLKEEGKPLLLKLHIQIGNNLR